MSIMPVIKIRIFRISKPEMNLFQARKYGTILIEIQNIIEAIRSNRVNITQHARKEAREDFLRLDDILFSVQHGEIIESYPEDFPYPSCVIFGRISSGDPVHSVWDTILKAELRS